MKLKNKKSKKIPLVTNGNFYEIAEIDSHAKVIFENILKLESEIKGFDEKEFSKLKVDVDKKQLELSNIDQQIGIITEKISKGEENIKKMKESITELTTVKKYISSLDEIQDNIFSRDGPVATSLRSWALNTISAKASEYLALLNTKIQRIALSEKQETSLLLVIQKMKFWTWNLLVVEKK